MADEVPVLAMQNNIAAAGGDAFITDSESMDDVVVVAMAAHFRFGDSKNCFAEELPRPILDVIANDPTSQLALAYRDYIRTVWVSVSKTATTIICLHAQPWLSS